MATKRPLRSVSPGDAPPPPKKTPATVSEAVTFGTRRDELLTMRARIAVAIDDPNIRGADLAALTRRLLEIGRDLEALDKAAEEDGRGGGETPDQQFDASAL